jgi:hypothetical protein
MQKPIHGLAVRCCLPLARGMNLAKSDYGRASRRFPRTKNAWMRAEASR